MIIKQSEQLFLYIYTHYARLRFEHDYALNTFMQNILWDIISFLLTQP